MYSESTDYMGLNTPIIIFLKSFKKNLKAMSLCFRFTIMLYLVLGHSHKMLKFLCCKVTKSKQFKHFRITFFLLQGLLSGLCGNFDSVTVNDMTTSNNMEVNNAQTFGNSWALGQV